MYGKKVLLLVPLLCCFVLLFSSCVKAEQSYLIETSESAERQETDDAFMPFAKTGASEYVYIEILP